MKKKNDKIIYVIMLIPLFLLIALFEIVPLLNMFIKSFTSEMSGEFTIENYLEIFSIKYYTLSIKNSLKISIISSLVGILVAIFGANALKNSTGKFKNYFMKVLNMTSNFAGIPLAFAFMILLGNSGFLVMLGKKYGIEYLAKFNIYSVTGILMSYIYFQIPLAILLMYPAFDSIKREYKEACRILHGNNISFWIYIGIPILMPSIIGTFGVLFANSIAAYSTAYALLGSNFSLIPIRISAMFIGDIVQRKELGSALSVVLLTSMARVTLLNHLALNYLKRGERK